MIRRPPRSTLFPYTTLFRSHLAVKHSNALPGVEPEELGTLVRQPGKISSIHAHSPILNARLLLVFGQCLSGGSLTDRRGPPRASRRKRPRNRRTQRPQPPTRRSRSAPTQIDTRPHGLENVTRRSHPGPRRRRHPALRPSPRPHVRALHENEYGGGREIFRVLPIFLRHWIIPCVRF